MAKTVILTGLRANNDLHIGNYFGALLPIIDMAKHHSGEYQINLFVPDLHSFTTPIEHQQLYNQALNNVKLFVASGLPINEPDIHIYRQSFIPAHSELTWILDCFTGVGEMNRMTQFKDKSGRIDIYEEIQNIKKHVGEMKNKFGDNYGQARILESVENILVPLFSYQERMEKETSVGLFNYPVLMAADILLYGATYIPVGDDQKQHLEFARDIATRMNSRFGELFVIPKDTKEQNNFFSKDQGLRIKSLVDPLKKMSKSDNNDRGAIFLNDQPDQAAQKVMSATTDSIGKINYDPENQPGISNLLQILALLKSTPQEEINANWNGKTSYGELKQAVADATHSFLTDFQNKLRAVSDNDINSKLEEGEQAMNTQANDRLFKVQQAVGLRP